MRTTKTKKKETVCYEQDHENLRNDPRLPDAHGNLPRGSTWRTTQPRPRADASSGTCTEAPPSAATPSAAATPPRSASPSWRTPRRCARPGCRSCRRSCWRADRQIVRQNMPRLSQTGHSVFRQAIRSGLKGRFSPSSLQLYRLRRQHRCAISH